MLCIWWTRRQVLHYELLPIRQTIPVDIYLQQLERVLVLVNPKVVLFLYDHVRLHVEQMALGNIGQHG